ncbi:hypothetical protein BU23DRAFT_555632 [Bimuria novae-zelandiae CBS 107.79]|uniref:F-box domain-containing protein n=1 Tax=Bimuria novae-zelandiae CBS 107.79 TaxID=1447943 RepID=A0A6A5V3F8_9PLEO|nr:hypothetical protein BU23DRAFT_555632 [Bimuria novae-zelandiae CBS 107.79]
MHHRKSLTTQSKQKEPPDDDRTRLPNEILMDVFERLLNKPSYLIPAMLTCKRWHHIAGTLLYQHVSLDSKLREDTSGARFGRFARQYDLIQSFSVRIAQVHLMGFSVRSTDAFDRLAELCEAVRRMKTLRTFALSFEESLDHLEGFSVPSAVIVLLLQSLPQSVVNLNLDCDCIIRPDLDQPHVCHAVSVLLPRLRSLRLRTSHLCAGLFSSISPEAILDYERPNKLKSKKTTSSLEYLVIRLIARPECAHLAHTALCYSGDRLLHGAKLASTLQELYNIGAFPLLQEFAVIGRVDAPSTLQNDNWNVFKIRTFARGISETITLPWCARGGSSSLYMIRDSEGDWFGSINDISNALEGPLLWTKTGIKAVRYLKSYERHNDWQLDRTKLAPRDSVIKKFGVSFRLWKHEDATRMKLLSARKAAGFGDTDVASQIVPDGWRWVIAEGPWNWTIEPMGVF